MQVLSNNQFVDPWRRWAANVLGISPGASTTQAQVALLRKLPEVNFVPPSAWKPALKVLKSEIPNPPFEILSGDQVFLSEQRTLLLQVESFAEEYWKLDSPRRRQRWHELYASVGHLPPLRARLRTLKAGLLLPLVTSESDRPGVMELVGHMQKLYVLGPTHRPVRRFEILREMEPAMVRWEKVARQLRGDFRDVIFLDPDLIDSLISWRSEKKRLARLRKRLLRNTSLWAWLRHAISIWLLIFLTWWIFYLVKYVLMP